MPLTPAQVAHALADLELPDGRSLGAADIVRALTVSRDGTVQFVIEAPDPATARALETVRATAAERVAALPGVTQVSVALTAHGPAARTEPPTRPGTVPSAPPKLDMAGGRATGPKSVPGVDRILAVGSGKGGVGKSTVSANLAVALARAGRRVGLLDADFYGPSQPRMMGVDTKPTSPDGKTIEPLTAHGVTVMSIGLMVEAEKAVVWRGPMLMSALQQMLEQVAWGDLDVLLIDMPPGTGDVQLTLCQKYALTGAVIVSTPQDVALMDARRALEMFHRMAVPVAGLVENMSTHICPQCGYEDHIFGHGGVAAEAQAHDLPYLGALPLNIAVRLASDSGTPVAATDNPLATPYGVVAAALVKAGFA